MKNVIELILKSHGLLGEFLNSTHFHTRIENDPDMEFEVLPDGSWRPVAIQFAIGVYKVAVKYSGVAEIDHAELKKQIKFAKSWAGNLKAQGYAK